MSIRIVGFVALLLFGVAAISQSYPTNNVLARIAMVQSSYGRGTIFSIDVDNREYWITAKHILTGAEHPPYGSVDATKPVTLSILDPNAEQEHWEAIKFSVIDTGNNIDIVVLAPPYAILKNPPRSAIAKSDGITLGGDCEFLGFPFGKTWRASLGGYGYWMPFAKHCTISTLAGGVYVLDGINNHGFSGGPVLYHTGPQQQIMGVISSIVTEPAEVIPSAVMRMPSAAPKKPPKPGHVDMNSGFLIAYSIDYATEAIKKNPIGPVREAEPK